MLEIDIPGRGTFGIRHVVCDYNGTIAVDGHLIEGGCEPHSKNQRVHPGQRAYG